MTIEVIAVVAVMFGIAVISAILSIIIVHFILNGLEALLVRGTPLRYTKRDGNEYQGEHNNKHTTTKDIPICPYNIRRYDLYEIIRNRINKMSESQRGKHRPEEETEANKQKYYRYINRCLPRPTPLSLPLPIKHIGNIVARLIAKCQLKWKRTRWLTMGATLEAIL